MEQTILIVEDETNIVDILSFNLEREGYQVETGFDGYVRPDHGRNIWGEDGKPGYGLYDRALGAAYLNGLFEAAEKELNR